MVNSRVSKLSGRCLRKFSSPDPPPSLPGDAPGSPWSSLYGANNKSGRKSSKTEFVSCFRSSGSISVPVNLCHVGLEEPSASESRRPKWSRLRKAATTEAAFHPNDSLINSTANNTETRLVHTQMAIVKELEPSKMAINWSRSSANITLTRSMSDANIFSSCVQDDMDVFDNRARQLLRFEHDWGPAPRIDTIREVVDDDVDNEDIKKDQGHDVNNEFNNCDENEQDKKVTVALDKLVNREDTTDDKIDTTANNSHTPTKRRDVKMMEKVDDMMNESNKQDVFNKKVDLCQDKIVTKEMSNTHKDIVIDELQESTRREKFDAIKESNKKNAYIESKYKEVRPHSEPLVAPYMDMERRGNDVAKVNNINAPEQNEAVKREEESKEQGVRGKVDFGGKSGDSRARQERLLVEGRTTTRLRHQPASTEEPTLATHSTSKSPRLPEVHSRMSVGVPITAAEFRAAARNALRARRASREEGVQKWINRLNDLVHNKNDASLDDKYDMENKEDMGEKGSDGCHCSKLVFGQIDRPSLLA